MYKRGLVSCHLDRVIDGKDEFTYYIYKHNSTEVTIRTHKNVVLPVTISIVLSGPRSKITVDGNNYYQVPAKNDLYLFVDRPLDGKTYTT